jgi:hypothetical protein
MIVGFYRLAVNHTSNRLAWSQRRRWIEGKTKNDVLSGFHSLRRRDQPSVGARSGLNDFTKTVGLEISFKSLYSKIFSVFSRY